LTVTNDEHPLLDPAKKARYNFRTGVERANGYLKDNLLPAKIFIKGFSKVSFVLMGRFMPCRPADYSALYPLKWLFWNRLN
jgi:hypothetical protein